MNITKKLAQVLILTTMAIAITTQSLQSEPKWQKELNAIEQQTYSAPYKRPFARHLVSSRYGQREIEKGGYVVNEFHRGVDYAVPVGTPVASAGDGQVIKVFTNKAYGLHYIVDHGVVSGNKVLTLYAHLSEPYLVKGQWVKAGDILGLSGDSGNAEGPHLHFEVLAGKVKPVNIYPGYYYHE